MSLFGTAGIRGPVSEITPELVVAVGRATARFAAESQDNPTVVVGRDGRVSGSALSAALRAGLESGGADVRRLGRVPTPALAFDSRGRYGIMLTASHNPPADNGIKLFDDGVEFDADAEAAIERQIEATTDPVDWRDWGTGERERILEPYRAAVTRYARSHGSEPAGVRVAVDCGNGMASVATPQVLRDLGSTVDAINTNVDGHFPARKSKPTDESISVLRQFVASGPQIAGIAHDGDADRIVVVDASGSVVHEDTILAILAEHYVKRAAVTDPIVITTPNASSRIDNRVHEAGGRIERVALGSLHEGIASVRDQGDTVVFAAEPWKHIHPEFGGWIDGVVSAAVTVRLIADADGLDSLRAPITERPYRKLSVDCPEELKTPAMDRLRTGLPDRFPDAEVSEEFGIRIDRPDGAWVLVRPSGTEPYLRIYAEGDDVDALVATVEGAARSAIEAG